MLGERNLSMKLAGTRLQDLENFRGKYQYILTTIPVAELPGPQTMYNHLMDEFKRRAVLAPKIAKSREAPAGHRRKICEWLWKQVKLAISLEQQKNRIGFDKQLKLKPQVITSSTSSTPVPANAASTKAALPVKPPKPDKPPKKTKKEKKKETAEAEAVALAAAAKAKVKAAKVKAPPTPKNPATPRTPRSAATSKTANMTAAKKAKVPCMFCLCL